MRCFRLVDFDTIELKIPVQFSAGKFQIPLGNDSFVNVDKGLMPDYGENGFVEHVELDSGDNSSIWLRPLRGKPDKQALVLLPPLSQFHYETLDGTHDTLTASTDNKALIVVLQAGNRLRVRPGKDLQIPAKVLQFNGDIVEFERT